MTYGAVSVKVDGSAQGDGTTDDTAAFTACIAMGGVILVPEGTYIVDYTDIDRDVTFVGEGGGRSVIKKKANSVGTSYSTDRRSYMFNVTDPDITVEFVGITFNGDYTGQVTTYAGATPANAGSGTGAEKGSATVMAVGGAVSTKHAVPVAATERLVVRFTDCTFKAYTTYAIYFDTAIDVGATAELDVTRCRFLDPAPSIAEYSAGGDGLPAQGYSWSANGSTSVGIFLTDGVRAHVRDSWFEDSRDPQSGTITTDSDFNLFNLPSIGIWITSESPSESTPEWSSATVSGCWFEGLGRPQTQGNGLGVVDFYVRGGELIFTDNTFLDCWEAPIRGKSNAKNLVVSGNVIENVQDLGLGIFVVPLTYAPQVGNYIFSNNIVKGASCGISVTGYNDVPATPDDADARVNNIVISGNIIEDMRGIDSSNAAITSAYGYLGQGIYVRYGADVVIVGNVVSGVRTVAGSLGAEYPIYVRDTIGGLRILGNTVTDADLDGIRVYSHVGPLDIAHNTVHDVDGSGISTNVTVGVTKIVDNQVADVGSYGIFVANTGRNVVSRNTVQRTGDTGIVAGSSASTAVVAHDNVIEDVAAASDATDKYGLDSGSMTAGTIEMRGNTIDGVSNSGSGNAHGIRAQFASVADTNVALIEGGVITDTQESGVFLNNVTGSVTGVRFLGIDTSASANNGAILVNGTGNTGLIHIVENSVDATSPPFPTTGAVTGPLLRAVRLIHETGNSWQPVQTLGSAAPSGGTWSVGDIVWHSAPASAGNIGWVCTTAGTPGTWKTFGDIA